MKKWQCSVCGFIHHGVEAPELCPICNAPAEAFDIFSNLSEKLEKSVKEAFVGESKAYIRNLAFARRAEEEELYSIAKLFKAVAEAEKIHASDFLNYLEGIIGDTEENLSTAFEHENQARVLEP